MSVIETSELVQHLPRDREKEAEVRLTIIRNGVKLDYPFIEAIRSALDICDEYVVVAGDSEDETLEQLQSLVLDFIESLELERFICLILRVLSTMEEVI